MDKPMAIVITATAYQMNRLPRNNPPASEAVMPRMLRQSEMPSTKARER